MRNVEWMRELSVACAVAGVLAFAVAFFDAPAERLELERAAPSTTLETESPAPALDPTATVGDEPKGDGQVKEKLSDFNGDGTLGVVPGSSPVLGSGPVLRFIVEVEGGLDVDGIAFAARVEEVLGSPRSWGPVGGVAFQRVDAGEVDFRVALVGPKVTDRLCAPLQTNGIFSCEMAGRAVLNYWRWMEGADAYGEDLASYRTYLINHEVGHALGHGHTVCPAANELAPVMVQQTKGVGECRPNPWPAP